MANVIYMYTTLLDEVPATVSNLTVTESLNEFSTLSFNLESDVKNQIAAQAMLPQTRVLVPETGQWFRLTNVNQVSEGKVRNYAVSAVHIATDLHDKYVEDKLMNTQSLDQCMQHITKETNFKYVIHDGFANYSFSDGFGADYADSLFMSTLKDNFGFEFYFDNWTIHIYKSLGELDQFVFVDGYNASKISWTEDYSNIRTKIKGLGKQNDDGSYTATAEYTSPNANIWGIKQAATVQDDRFTNKTALLNYIKSQLQDYPIVQYSMERVDFERHARLSDINKVKIGNSGLIKDRLGVDVDVRIIGITSHPQDAKQSDSVIFGNKLFDYATNYAKRQQVRKSNESISKSVKQLEQNVTSMMNNGAWYIWS